MAQSSAESASKERRLSKNNHGSSIKQRQNASGTTLLEPHVAILADLSSKYDVLTASVISSSKIRQRTTSATGHLLAAGGSDKPRIVLLHARADCLSKLITIAETTKRVLSQEGQPWWQYNELYAQPERPKKCTDLVEETVLTRDGLEDEEESHFETMAPRLEQAIYPEPKTRSVKALRIFLTTAPVPDLKQKKSVTMQASAGAS